MLNYVWQAIEKLKKHFFRLDLFKNTLVYYVTTHNKKSFVSYHKQLYVKFLSNLVKSALTNERHTVDFSSRKMNLYCVLKNIKNIC